MERTFCTIWTQIKLNIAITSRNILVSVTIVFHLKCFPQHFVVVVVVPLFSCLTCLYCCCTLLIRFCFLHRHFCFMLLTSSSPALWWSSSRLMWAPSHALLVAKSNTADGGKKNGHYISHVTHGNTCWWEIAYPAEGSLPAHVIIWWFVVILFRIPCWTSLNKSISCHFRDNYISSDNVGN